jgi:hypothetical protein
MLRDTNLSESNSLAEERPVAKPPMINPASKGLRIGSAEHYMPLPPRFANGRGERARPLWRIELHGLEAGPMGFDIYDDTVIGRGAGPDGPDLDLTPFRALELGVSKRHAMLRPTGKQLFLIDLVSNNGIRVNSVPLPVGRAYPLKHNDSINLGALSFQVKIIGAPGTPVRK